MSTTEEIKEKVDDQTKIIEIKPKKSFLSTDELFAQRNMQIEPLRIEKFAKRLPKEEEEQKLNALYENMRKRLALPRIERFGGRSLAVWDAREKAMCVMRKVGKFENFGYTRNSKLYLEFYEAMYLLEMNRMQLEFDDMILSIEEAYVLLLGEEATQKFDEYLVYALLTRVGYILVKYNNKYYDSTDEETEEDVRKMSLKIHVPLIAKTANDCVWQILQQNLCNIPVPEVTKKLPFYGEIAANIEKVKNNIQQQTQMGATVAGKDENLVDNMPVDENEDEKNEAQEKPTCCKNVVNSSKITIDEYKRKSMKTHKTKSKRKRHDKAQTLQDVQHKSFLDFLKNENEYLQFKQMFEQLDFIKLHTSDIAYYEKCLSFKISFDLYLHNDGFKKSAPPPPKLRVVILGANAHFPTHREIVKCYKQQRQPTPLLLMTVSESKKINGYLYHFTK